MSFQKFLDNLLDENEHEVDSTELEYQKKLGSGSFGEVYSASWKKTPVAVKILSSHLEDKQEFKNEYNFLQKLSHPNIVQFYGIITDVKVGIVLELMEDSLEKYNISNTPKEQCLKFVLDVARGLHYLHSKKIIHRDIKPSNLLLTKSKQVKISDFGLSCFQYDPIQYYKMSREPENYRYMAPEVIKGEPYNTSVDIFSLGVIMYKLVEDVPYKNLTITEIIVASTEKKYVPKFKSKSTKELIESCWNYNTKERLTASQVIDEVQEVIKNRKKSYLSKVTGLFNIIP